ncbi:hypothetical protein BCR44DRAFT_1498086 [Catenaria anguillulae PL171]|uniref:J domain-containing protein n=1 Tax=Catenaria anguillulae PL171 TaxID=765915 RepID=A0A1Y2HST2_9FUNG|nr:hypothetical protein BCR44DRAFT_1498086 [Catenaria anguillulae PL171]
MTESFGTLGKHASCNPESCPAHLPPRPSDYYSVLHIQPSAPFKDVLKAYQREALKLHPDTHPTATDNVTSAAFELVNEAFFVLSDTKRRQAYDQARNQLLKSNNATASLTTAPDADNVQRAFQAFLGVDPHVMKVFDEVFEPLIASELDAMADEEHRQRSAAGGGAGSTWGILGSISGIIMGFIVANVPGAAVGAVAGYKLGHVRDRTGMAVMDVFRNLSSEQRQTVLGRLARKLIF